jgi:DNA polymerase elongation subunit (family B)
MGYISALYHRRNNKVIVWERINEQRIVRYYEPEFYFYVPSKTGTSHNIYGETVRKFDFDTREEFDEAIQRCKEKGIRTFEEDIPIEIRTLSTHYHDSPAPALTITFFDIEVAYDKNIGFAGIENPYAPINSVAMYHMHQNKYVVLVVQPTSDKAIYGKNGKRFGLAGDEFYKVLNDIAPLDKNIEIFFCKDEKELLLKFLDEIEESDVISGYNSDFFDIPYIGKRLEKIGQSAFKRLSFPEAPAPRYRSVEKKGWGKPNETLDIYGRIKADYLDLYKKYEVAEKPSYKLESIADEVLPELPKLEYEGNLADLYTGNFPWFIRYNIRDTEILKGFEDKLGYVALSNELYHLSTGLFKHITGTLRLAEFATVNYCHHKLGGLIVPNCKETEQDDDDEARIQGAFVLEPRPGMHEWIGSIDINSLYPSAIRAINISPETLIGQFETNVAAAEAIAKGTDEVLTLVYDEQGVQTKTTQSYTALEWRDILTHNKCAVSGYGTVFSQKKKGIIPTILEDWYSMRKHYQKLMKEAKAAGDKEKAAYYNRLQFVFKIKLNSFYGALTNPYFRFFDERMGESTTGTGRMILRHQCAKVNEVLTGDHVDSGGVIIYGDSVANDTMITTPHGDLKIEDLFTSVDVRINDKEYCNTNFECLTYDEASNQTCFQPVKYIVRHKINKKMYRVWISNIRYVDITEDHSLIGYNSTRTFKGKDGESRLTPVTVSNADMLKIKSLIMPRKLPRTNIISKNYPKEVYELMGYIIGDGHVEHKIEGGVGLSIGRLGREEIINKLINPLIEQNYITSVIRQKNEHDIRMCGTTIWKLLKKELYSTGKKDIPAWLFDETEENICSFLRGYFTADGSVDMNGTIKLCSINRDWIESAHKLLLCCGIASNYFAGKTENAYKGKKTGTYINYLTVYDCKRFGERVGFLAKQKQRRIPCKYGRRKQHLDQYDFAICSITKVEELPQYNEYVYDIEVSNTHTFFANGILAHNTDSTYFETRPPSNTAEEAIKIADAVANKVNESFKEFMEQTFLCGDGYSSFIKAGREIVSDRGIFVEKKKRYILHIIDNEGERVDKMKIMGMDTKKTTMPKEVANKLNKFIERLLKGASWDDIAADIVAYKDELRHPGNIMSIGLPKGIKNVEKYTDEFETSIKPRIPGHVMAAIFYNRCLKRYNDKEHTPITSGQKIKVFYLAHVYDNTFKSIALPTDIETIPEWFYNFQIDYEAHIERLVDNPLEGILDAIKERIPAKHELTISNFFEF